MLIFDDTSSTILIDDIYSPTLTEHVWVLDLEMMDYTLAPLLLMEEITCPSITLEVFGYAFILPANWYVLIYDTETTQLDTVCVADLAGREFTALSYGPHRSSVISAKITVVDYSSNHKNVGPSLNKHQMLCHPVAPNLWINISSTDPYNKYLRDTVVGDLI